MPDGQKPVLTGFEFHSIEFGNNQFLSLPSCPTGKRHLVVSTAQINYLNWFSKTSIIGWHKASK